MHHGRVTSFIAALAVTGAAALLAQGPFPGFGQGQGSLKSVRVPRVPNLEQYVKDEQVLVALGKALFWEMQLGSDGRVACATCHFHAGADHRVRNQLSNPLAAFPSNYTLATDDFPFHKLADPLDNRSDVLRDTSARAGSAGVVRRTDSGEDLTSVFAISGLNARQVTARKTPSTINAAYYYRNFWDGRASNIFTGLTPFGDSDTRDNALVMLNGSLVPERVRLENSSLASQAVGPPLSSVEMSYEGRTWLKVGKRILALRPLAAQRVMTDDSVLGSYADPSGLGLAARYGYLQLVKAAFQPAYWSSDQFVDGEFTQAESNFALFFGLAVQAYESTLIADDSRYDQFVEGKTAALTATEQAGLQVFQRRAGCGGCHSGAEFTQASYGSVAGRGVLQRNRGGTGGDTGFFRTGVRPVTEDGGIGVNDDFGKPLSAATSGVNVVGLFKTPQLRNVDLTGPYMHNGGQSTLEQVVEFYSRGGDFNAAGLRRLNLTADERAQLVAFLKALSDDRVRYERAPFDHPELCVPVGHDEAPDSASPKSAVDRWAGVPAVGAKGNAVPLQTFDELLRGVGVDGSRAHTLADACAIR